MQPCAVDVHHAFGIWSIRQRYPNALPHVRCMYMLQPDTTSDI